MRKESSQKKFVVGARPPQKLTGEAKQLLSNAKPAKKALTRAAKAVKLQVVDGEKVAI